MSPVSEAQSTAVICRLSFSPATSTRLEPRASMVQLEEGTRFIPVCSQFKINSSGMSSIFTVTISCRNLAFTCSKFSTVTLLFVVLGLLTNLMC